MSDYKKDCPSCKHTMTLLLNNFVCDWCDGKVVEEWEKEEVTKPYGRPPSMMQGSPQPSYGYYSFDDVDLDDDDFIVDQDYD